MTFWYFRIILLLVQIATLLRRWLSQVWEELTRIRPTDSRPHQRSINDAMMRRHIDDDGDQDDDGGDDADDHGDGLAELNLNRLSVS